MIPAKWPIICLKHLQESSSYQAVCIYIYINIYIYKYYIYIYIYIYIDRYTFTVHIFILSIIGMQISWSPISIECSPLFAWDLPRALLQWQKICFRRPGNLGVPTTFGPSGIVDGSEIRRENQLRLVVYPWFTGFYISQWLGMGFGTIISIQGRIPTPNPGLVELFRV